MKFGRRACIACCVGVLSAACRPVPPPPDLESVASRYIQLTRELARHDPSLVDHWLTDPPPTDTTGRQPVATLQLAIVALARDAAAASPETSGEDRRRADWLVGQTRALRLAADRLMGESLPFDTEARQAFGIDPGHADRFQGDRALETLAEILPGPGPLAERLSRFRARFAIPSAARDAVMQAAFDACREATRLELPLPEDEQVEFAFVEGLPWDAHATYRGGHRTHIDINGAAALDLTRALRLACHEGYAGHHAQHIWVADELVVRRRWQEYGLVPGFGPALLIAEGAADLGTDLAMPPDRRLEIYASQLAPAAGLHVTAEDLSRLSRVEQAQAALEPLIGDVARDYLDNRATAAMTAERLDREVLIGGDTFVHFIERRRTRILAYTDGRRLAAERLGDAGLAGLHEIFVPPR